MKSLISLWKFSRPHTIIGSTISITALYAMACIEADFMEHLPLLLLAIITGITCNIFIVGINQIEDIDIDKINKPYLPLASGELSIKWAYRIIYTAMLISIICATYISAVLLGVVCLSLLIGMAYSLPPFNFKKHHLPAALAITIVRGLLVNLGGFYVFTSVLYGEGYISDDVWLLSIFIIAFSIAIAWFKDLPDITGDSKFNIRTFAILYSSRTAFYSGTILVISAFLLNIYFNILTDFLNPDASHHLYLVIGNLLLLILFIINAFMVKLASPVSIMQFYKRFWLFFFAEYALYLVVFINK